MSYKVFEEDEVIKVVMVQIYVTVVLSVFLTF